MSANLNRREFIEASAAALGLGLAAGADAADAPRLPQRTLGRTGVQVGIVGLGGVGFLTDWTDKDAIAKLLNEALDSGINYFDTARIYGKGVSEESLGLLMGTARRKEAFLATKTNNRTYDGAMKDIEASLKALRTNYLDLIQIHGFALNPKDDVAAIEQRDGVLTALRRLREQKVVRFIGITGHVDTPKLKDALQAYDFDTLLCWVNPRAQCRWVETELIPVAVQKKMGIVAMKAYGGGKPGALVGDGPGKAPVADLLRFTLTAPIHTTVPAMDNEKQLRQNLALARSFTPMPQKERQALIDRIAQK